MRSVRTSLFDKQYKVHTSHSHGTRWSLLSPLVTAYYNRTRWCKGQGAHAQNHTTEQRDALLPSSCSVVYSPAREMPHSALSSKHVSLAVPLSAPLVALRVAHIHVPILRLISPSAKARGMLCSARDGDINDLYFDAIRSRCHRCVVVGRPQVCERGVE